MKKQILILLLLSIATATFSSNNEKKNDPKFFERTFKSIGLGHSICQYFYQLAKHPKQQVHINNVFANGKKIDNITISLRKINLAYYMTTGMLKYGIGKIIGREIDNF